MNAPPSVPPQKPSRRLQVWLTAAVLAIAAGAVAAALPRESSVPVSGFRVIATYPHDPGAFCQGLVYDGETLYEGTGVYGESSLRRVDLETGRVQQLVPLDAKYFGEGITLLGERIYQLTWRNRLGVIYSKADLTPMSSFRYAGEGWGLTTDGKRLILSDGTATLRFLNPQTFQVEKQLTVRTPTRLLDQLNELEFVDGEIYANIWYSDHIARISPETGRVLGWIDLSSLYPANQRPSKEHVLNGIAYDAQRKQLLVTGKNWPRLYRIELTPPR